MRDYLFSGKRKDNGEMIFGSLREIWSSVGQEAQFTICPAKRFANDGFTDLDEAEIIPETVGEFIGLLDKNGKEIFEGSIVKDEHGNIGVITYSEHFCGWRIVFHKASPDLIGEYGCQIFDWIYPKMTLEVIGNIHDNKKLLEGK